MSLNRLEVELKFINQLEKLYDFNSSYNTVAKSYLKFELRDRMKMEYSYYIDIYSNVDTEDIKEEFLKLKRDLVSSN